MAKELSSVEWLLDWMGKNQYFIGNDLLEAVEKAKEMEREQKAKAIDDDFMHHIRRTTTMHELKTDDKTKHITKTFKSE